MRTHVAKAVGVKELRSQGDDMDLGIQAQAEPRNQGAEEMWSKTVEDRRKRGVKEMKCPGL